jgi:multidrug efflux pump subunit AcrA (membrane-fusion protein)
LQKRREQIERLEAEHARLDQAATQEQAARLAPLERELAAERERKAKAAAQVADTQAALDRDKTALREAERVVREYYEALNRRDFAAAKALYLNPGPRLETSFGFIDRPGLFTVNEIRSKEIAPDASLVVVGADLDARGGKERWRGTLKVSSESGTWKITRIDLAKAVDVAGGGK